MKNEKGITLVELLATLAIMGIIVVLIASVLINGTNASNRTATKQQLQQEANVIVEQIRTSYLQNEKSESIDDKFLVKVEGDELKITTEDQVDKTVLSKGYQYHLNENNETELVTLDRTITSPFYLEICPKNLSKKCEENQSFEVKTSFSKLK